MRVIRVLSRLAILSVAAAAFVALTAFCGNSVRPIPDPQWRLGRDHRPSSPDIGQFAEFIGEAMVVGIYAVAGRIVLRLRLSPASRSEGLPILLGLHRVRKDCKQRQVQNIQP